MQRRLRRGYRREGGGYLLVSIEFVRKYNHIGTQLFCFPKQRTIRDSCKQTNLKKEEEEQQEGRGGEGKGGEREERENREEEKEDEKYHIF